MAIKPTQPQNTDPLQGLSLNDIDLSDPETRNYVSQYVDMDDPETKRYFDQFQQAEALPANTTTDIDNRQVQKLAPDEKIEFGAGPNEAGLADYNKYIADQNKYNEETRAEAEKLLNSGASFDQINEYTSSRGSPLDPKLWQPAIEAVTKGQHVSPVLGMVHPQTPEKAEPAPERTMAQRLADNLTDATAHDFWGAFSRNVYDWMDTGKDELKKQIPGMSDDFYEYLQTEMVNQAQQRLRQEMALKAQADPAWRPDQSFLENALAVNRWGPTVLGQLIGSIGPESFINPGSSAVRRIGAQGAISGLANIGYQGLDVAQGVSDQYDPLQTVGAIAAGAGLQGLGELGGAALGRFRTKVEPSEATPSRSFTDSEKAVDTALSQPVPKVGKKGTYGKKGQVAIDARKTEVVNYINDLVDHQKWKNSPQFEVVGHTNDIADPNIRAKAQAEAADKDALGFLGDDGVVRIFANKVRNKDELNSVIFHEGLGHFGLAQKFGDDLDNLLGRILDKNVGNFGDKVDAWLKANPDGYKNDPLRNIRVAEEVLANMSEKGAIPPKIFDVIVNHIKDFARQMGLDLSYSQREIKTILGMAHNSVIRGNGRDVTANGFRFDRLSPEDTQAFMEYSTGRNIRPSQLLDELDRGVNPQAEADINTRADQLRNIEAARQASRENSPEGWEEQLVNLNTGEDGPEVRMWSTEGLRRRFEQQDASSGNRYMRRSDVDEDEYPIKSVKETYDSLSEGYVDPGPRTWAEDKAAARAAGLTAKQYNKTKSVGELSKKLFQAERAGRVLDEKISALNEKLDGPDWTLKDKENYLKAVAEYNYLMGRIYDDQAEVGRALNAIKALSFTKRKVSDLNEALEQNGGSLAALSDEETFLRFARQVQALMNSQNPVGAAQAVRQIMKPYWWQYLLTFRHTAMLSSMGTHMKNTIDNVNQIGRELRDTALGLPGGIVRYPVNKALQAVGSNRQLKQGVSPQEIAGRLYGLLRAAADMGTYSETAKVFQQGHANRVLNSKVEMADARIPGLSKVNDFLAAQDTFFRAFFMNSNLHAIGVRQAREAGFKDLAAFEEGSNRAANPTKEMLEEAQKMSDISLMVDSPEYMSRLEALKAIRPGMSTGQQIEAFAANMILPFFRVTNRMIFRKIRYIPGLNLIDRVTREDLLAGGARADIAVGRMVYGGALLYYYWNQAGKGNVVGEEENYQKLRALEGGGYLPNSVKEDGKYVDATALDLASPFDPFDLHNSVAAQVATIRKQYEEGTADDENVAKGLALASMTMMSQLAGQGFAENINMYTEPFSNQRNSADRENAFAGVVGNIASSFVPAGVRQLNQGVFDTTKRDTTGDGGFLDRVYGRVAAGIPGLSNQLPEKRTVYGRTQDQGRSLSGTQNYQSIIDEPAINELQRLERTTKSPVVTEAPRTIQVNGDEYKITGEARAAYQQRTGELFIEGFKNWMDSPEYQSLTDPQKIVLVKRLRKAAAQAAKEELFLNEEQDQNDNGE